MTYGGEDSPVLGGEIAESFGVELHGGRLCRGLVWQCEMEQSYRCCGLRTKVRSWRRMMIQRATVITTLPSSVSYLTQKSDFYLIACLFPLFALDQFTFVLH